jgi:hypothetical protein
MGFIERQDKEAKGSFSAQLMEAERVMVASEGDAKQAEMRMTHLKTAIKQKTTEAKAAEAEHSKFKKDLEKKQEKVTQLQAELARLGFDPADFKNTETAYVCFRLHEMGGWLRPNV